MPMTVIQWFPGHMAKAKREVQEKLKLIDVAFELLDARVPMSSRNPMIDEILGQKPRLILLNKADMADEAVTEQWIRYFHDQGRLALPIDAQSGTGVRQIAAAAKEMVKDKFEKMRAKGIKKPAPGSRAHRRHPERRQVDADQPARRPPYRENRRQAGGDKSAAMD